ncbi:MAG: cupin domain-containing protein [Neisseria sp.]|uniref:JmjC domain-containing protein n=1 Tax=Neisseria sp. TaxID=192066 RepID=UPI0026DAFA34|nr:cupin domain-containing protein [Neisseria sp.]MDO4248620.1 cupin domain-containing protein [Neisseria sp.]
MNIDFQLPQDTFLSEYRYRKPYLFKQAVSLPDRETVWRGINEMYQRANPADDLFKFRKGALIPKEHYVESFNDVGRIRYRFKKAAVYEYLKDGATLVYNRINNEPFSDNIARQIARFTQAHTIVSGYLAFGEDASYKNHWDTRDVFAVQLIGKKHWSLSAPNFDMPLYMQQSKDLPHIPEPETADMEVVLEAGDILYIPRGWWHNPVPMGCETFHLAVGTFPPNGYNYMEWLMKKVPDIAGFRHSLQSWTHDEGRLKAAAEEFAAQITEKINYETFMQEFLGDQRTDSGFNFEILGNPYSEGLPEDALLRLNTIDDSTLEKGYLISNGIKLNLDEENIHLLKKLRPNRSVTLQQLYQEKSGKEQHKIREIIERLAQFDVLEINN